MDSAPSEIGSCSGFRKRKWIPQIYADSPSEFADSTYSCRFHGSLSLLNTYISFCFWIPQTVPDYAKFVNFVVDSAKLLLLEQL